MLPCVLASCQIPDSSSDYLTKDVWRKNWILFSFIKDVIKFDIREQDCGQSYHRSVVVLSFWGRLRNRDRCVVVFLLLFRVYIHIQVWLPSLGSFSLPSLTWTQPSFCIIGHVWMYRNLLPTHLGFNDPLDILKWCTGFLNLIKRQESADTTVLCPGLDWVTMVAVLSAPGTRWSL